MKSTEVGEVAETLHFGTCKECGRDFAYKDQFMLCIFSGGKVCRNRDDCRLRRGKQSRQKTEIAKPSVSGSR